MTDKRKQELNGATSYAEIVPMDAEWLWQGRIPLNWLTLIAGDGGIGKGRLLARLAKIVTRGLDMPDGSPGVPRGSVVMVSAEDDPNMTMAHRLRAEDVDLTKVYDMPARQFSIPDSIPALREVIRAIGDVRLVILDPMSAVSSIPLTSGSQRIRRVLMMPMEDLAKDENIALVVVHHTVKSGRTAGSKTITDAARMILRVTRNPADERVRFISVEKSNNSDDGIPDVAYTIAGDPPVIQWLEVPGDSDVGKPAPTTAELVLAILADDSADVERAPDGSVHVQRLAHALAMPVGTVRVALTRLKDAGDVMPGSQRGYWRVRPAAELIALKPLDK
jgi:archaellum biogenesis ATPase FlaH